MKNSDLVNLGIIGGFISTIIYAVKVTSALNDVRARWEWAVDNLSDDVIIRQEVVDDAVRIAAEKAARDEAVRACNKLTDIMATELKSEVRKEVAKAKSDIAPNVRKELERQIGKLDISDIREEIISEAKETAATKFKEDLDEVLENHNKELKSITKIYQNIANTMAGSKGA